MTVSLLQPSFSRGEIAESLTARTDLDAYMTALRRCRNFMVSPYGGIMNRPGTYFIAETEGNEVARMIRFKFNASDTYALEFTHLKMRVYRNGGLVLSGMSPFLLTTPFTRDEIFDLRFVQSADVMDIVHPNHKPQKLRRFDHDNWTISDVSLVPSIAAPTGLNAVASAPGSSVTYSYVVTAVKDDETEEESLASTADTVSSDLLNPPNVINLSWTAVPGALNYNIYKDDTGGGIFGFIGRASTTTFTDRNITPVKADTPPTGEDPFVGAGNYPGAVAYYQQRMVYAGSNNKPQTLWFSRPGVFTNFGSSFPIKDDDSIIWTMASNEVNRINHLVPLRSLMTFTDGAEWTIQGGAAGFTPKTINGEPQTYNGIGDLRPLVINNTVIYSQERGREVTAFGYSLQSDGFSGTDISVLSPHFLEDFGLVDWDFQQIPYSIVWGVREDGALLGLTYMPEQSVTGWHLHTTDGLYKSVCSVPEGREDSLYFCVERVINGVTKHYVERAASRTPARFGTEVVVAKSFFVDCGLMYDGTNYGPETMTLSGGVDWQYPETLTLVSSNGSRFSAGDVGDEIQYIDLAVGQPFRMTILAYTSGSTVTVRPIGVVPEAIRGPSFTRWAFARDNFSGLDHLEGKKVAVLADGNVVGQQTVSGGGITIPTPAAIAVIGLPYASEAETLEVTIPNQETMLDKRKIISKVTIVMDESRGGLIGRNASDLYEPKQRTDSDNYGSMAAITGKQTVTITDTWQGNGRIVIQQNDPLPMSILAVIPQADFGGAK